MIAHLAQYHAVLTKASCKPSNGCHTLTSPAQKLKPSMHWSQVCHLAQYHAVQNIEWLPHSDIPSSEAKAVNALIPSLRTWRRKGSTPPSVKPGCNSRTFSDISDCSEPRVTTYRRQARYKSRNNSCADQLHAFTNKRNTSLQLKLAKLCGFTKS